jgi:hypothetical protein
VKYRYSRNHTVGIVEPVSDVVHEQLEPPAVPPVATLTPRLPCAAWVESEASVPPATIVMVSKKLPDTPPVLPPAPAVSVVPLGVMPSKLLTRVVI